MQRGLFYRLLKVILVEERKLNIEELQIKLEAKKMGIEILGWINVST
jgi:hypothetical protein